MPFPKIEETPLLSVLKKVMPPETPDAKRSVQAIAIAIGLSHQAVYIWLNKQKLPPKQVARILRAAEGRISREELYPFLCPTA